MLRLTPEPGMEEPTRALERIGALALPTSDCTLTLPLPSTSWVPPIFARCAICIVAVAVLLLTEAMLRVICEPNTIASAPVFALAVRLTSPAETRIVPLPPPRPPRRPMSEL